MNVKSWSDLKVTDYRPKKGIIKVRNPQELETQIDATTGKVLKTQQRWNDFINQMHDGSAFGARLWLFLPIALFTLYLTLSGTYMLVIITTRKIRSVLQSNRPRKFRQRRFSFSLFCVKAHYWLALVVLLPWLVVLVSGLVLQVRQELGVEPIFAQGSATVPVLNYQQVLQITKTIPELGVEDWPDVWRVYTYPTKGLMEVRTKRGITAQIDAASGEILSVVPRSSDFWEDIHQGIFGRHHLHSGDITPKEKIDLALNIFLPASIVIILVLTTGVVFFVRKEIILQRRGPATRLKETAPLSSSKSGLHQSSGRTP